MHGVCTQVATIFLHGTIYLLYSELNDIKNHNNNFYLCRFFRFALLEHSAKKFDTGSVPSAFFSGAVISEF